MMSDSPPLPEAPGPGERRLAAILAMDVVGYSRMMEADEDATLARLRWLRQTLVEPHVAQHRGRVFKTMGDGLLVEFASAVDAVSAAVAIQQALAAAQIDALEDRTIRLRCGIHVGDIVSDGSDVLGDGVNLAARLEGIAEPGTVYVSRNVRDAARGAAQVEFEDLGERQVKNIQRPVQVYRVRLAGTKAASGPAAPGRSAGPDRLLPLLVGAVVLLAIGLAGIAWERGWLALAPARPDLRDRAADSGGRGRDAARLCRRPGRGDVGAVHPGSR
jgi:class 3 adenylate cyclase